MGTRGKISFLLFILLYCHIAKSQHESANLPKNITQRIYGYVKDETSKQPLAGAVVSIVTIPGKIALTDSNGYFRFDSIEVGRHNFEFSFIGYEDFSLSAVEVIAGKTLELNISLKEKFRQLKEVTIRGRKRVPSNEFATVSTRSFTVDEIKRYSTALADPARMVMNFPGVAASGDNSNSLVIRGNSPSGLLWRLEGIEIPNPNHFSSLGNSGGAISMLNANTLGSAEFYTGAFIPEIGNALSGAMDIYLRNGTITRAEHSVQIGTLGMELASEGPFAKNKNASYLFSYRYSTFAVIQNFIAIGPSIPNYQDLSFKLNFPTKKAGTFSFFGLGGSTNDEHNAIPDSSVWVSKNDSHSFSRKTFMGVTGISHEIFLNKRSYIKSVIAVSYDKTVDQVDTLNPANAYNRKLIEQTNFIDKAIRLSTFYNQKINSNHSFRVGLVVQRLGYDLSYRYFERDSNNWKSILDGAGNTSLYEAYFQWKAKFTSRMTAVAGLHSSYFALNNKKSIEPRASIAYSLYKTKLSIAAGFHSRPEHISTYLFQKVDLGQPINYPNKNLELSRAFHLVAGIDRNIFTNYIFKTEIYFQKLYHIPVEADSASGFSMLNAEDVFSLLQTNAPLSSKGTGSNYGIDFSVEHPLRDGYFIVATASLFKSTYTNYKGDSYNTHFNRGYQVNIIAGKEIKLNPSGNQVIGINGKLLYSGGLRESPIDFVQSAITGRTTYVQGQYFTKQVPAYYRNDASIYFKWNRKKATHYLEAAAQNITNRRNYAFSYFDTSTGSIAHTNQLGIIPNISYRIDFHLKD